MKVRRHKFFKKDELKAKLTDEQYTKRLIYLTLILDGKPLPAVARGAKIGSLKDC